MTIPYFTTPLDANARFSFDEQVVACFPDMIRRVVCLVRTDARHVADFAKRHCQFRQTNSDGNKVSRVYDLGCSLGAVSFALAGEFAPQDCKSKPLISQSR